MREQRLTAKYPLGRDRSGDHPRFEGGRADAVRRDRPPPGVSPGMIRQRYLQIVEDGVLQIVSATPLLEFLAEDLGTAEGIRSTVTLMYLEFVKEAYV